MGRSKVPMQIRCSDADIINLVEGVKESVAAITKVELVGIVGIDSEVPAFTVTDSIKAGLAIGLTCPEETNFSKIETKISKKLGVVEKSLTSLTKKMDAQT